MAKLKRKRAGISSGNITEVMDAAQAAAESGADQKYIENPYNKKLDEDLKKVATAQRDAQRKVEAADYADMIRDNPVKNLDAETQAYVKKHKDATIEPIPEPEKPKGQPRPKPEPEASDPSKAVLVVPQPSKSGGAGSSGASSGGSGAGGGGSGGSGSGGSGSGPTNSGKSRTERMKDFFSRKKTVNPTIVGEEKIDEPYTILGKKSLLPEFERNTGLTDLQADQLARKGGYYTSIKVLRQRKQELIYEEERLLKQEKDLNEEVFGKNLKIIDLQKKRDMALNRYNQLYNKSKLQSLSPEEGKELADLAQQVSDWNIELENLKDAYQSPTARNYARNVINSRLNNFKIKSDDLFDEFNKYYTAVGIGKESKDKEEGWQAQAANFSLNAQNLLGKPVINDISQQVGYGGMTGRSAVEGINAITGGYKVRDEANSWTRTNVGDRQLVESLVNVRPNRVITPFGVPGTVGESNLSQQFQYSSPLRRIGVGDVTARGGYQINIEDIHRRKGNSQPAIVRKKLMQKKLAKQKKLAEQQKLAEQRKLAEKKMFVTSKNVIKTSMIIKNPGVAKAISFVGKIQSPMVGGVKDIKGLNNEVTAKSSSPLGKSSNLTVGNNTINMKSIKSFASMAVITNMKKKKVTK